MKALPLVQSACLHHTFEPTLHFTLTALTIGGLYNRSSRVRTDEWGGVRTGRS